ncbi:MAG: SusC/RagA family TonB-linked outer membrane protein [Gemmatimonadales bacterium]
MRIKMGLLTLLMLLLLGRVDASAQTRVLNGRVTDAVSNEPLAGAEVLIPNTTIRTTVREDGTYSIGIPIGRVSVLFRMIGFQRALVTVTGTQRTLDVSLKQDILQLEEVVVTGQATGVERRNLANGVSTVSADQLEVAPAASVEQQIQGKVAGANIQANSGAPGGGLQVELRGVTSINAVAQPLYVIDGVLVSDVAIPSNANAVTAASGGSNPSLTQDNQVNRIVDINPADIENIEILKGPSAAAIYGSQASSGVIIITTKRGRSGRPQINVSERFGTFDLAHKLGFRPRNFASAAAADSGLGLAPGTAAQYGFQPGKSYDLEEDLAGRHPLSSQSSISVSGGDEDTRYFVSGLWHDDGGIMPNSGFEKQSLRVNVDQKIGSRFALQVSSNLAHSNAQRALSNNDNAGVSPFMVFPFTPNVFDLSICKESDPRPICANAAGTFPANPFERSNPLQTISRMSNDEDVYRFIGSARLEAEAVRSEKHNVKLVGSVGVDRFSQKNALLFPSILQFEDDDGLPGTSLLSNSDNENINLDGSVVYKFSPISGAYTATTSAGIQYSTTDLNVSRITARNVVPGQSNVNAATNIQVNELRQRVKTLGLYVQEEVLIRERLLLTAGFRADQNSASTNDDKLFAYPKAAASYRVPVQNGFLDEIKLRSAYGESANQPVFGAKFTPLTATVNIGGLPGFQVQGPVVINDIKPERQREIEAGFDATLFGGKASLDVTGWHRSVSDLILQRQLAPSSGFTQEVFNGGRMRVNGVDVGLALVPAQSSNFSWVFRTTFSLNRSKVTDLPVPAFLPANAGFGTGLGSFKIEKGQSATQIVGNVPDGSGGTVIKKVGDSNPDFRFTFNNDIKWHGFSLFSLWDWQQGSDIVNLTRLLYDAGSNTADYDEIDPGSGDPKGLHRITTFGTDIRVYVEDASFLKLRELTLSYEVPRNVINRIWPAARYVRLSVSGRNIITFTDYSGMDPEVSNFGNQGIGRNIDVAPFPRTRSWWFGIDLGF